MARPTAKSLTLRAARVRLVALDVDGVLTDGRLYFGARGESLKAFDVRDVAARARELGITQLLQGQDDKRASLQGLLERAGLEARQCAFMGDDWPDLGALAAAGLAATVADAPDEVKRRVHWIAPSPGGRGAVRDLARLVLRAQGRFDALLRSAAGEAVYG
jgi:3-deoxy-D-manno-octulosonate 8-phosphate phosphatase (KDO 8-P phosphatase)